MPQTACQIGVGGQILERHLESCQELGGRYLPNLPTLPFLPASQYPNVPRRRLPFNSILANSRWATMPSDNLRARLKSRIGSSQFLDYIYRALRCGAYPLQGIYYFARHREFWPLWAGRLLPLSIISLIVYVILFLFAYLPQVAFLAIWQGRGAWVNGLILTLGEGQVLIQTLFEGFFVDECRVDVFDVRFLRLLGPVLGPS